MMQVDIESILREELHRIAPDVDPDAIHPSTDLREECDIDSLDFLNLVTALGKALSIDMPEADYPRMRSYNDLLAYLQEKQR